MVYNRIPSDMILIRIPNKNTYVPKDAIPPKPGEVFIVKVQTNELNNHPFQQLGVYDASRTIDMEIVSPEMYYAILEFGVLGNNQKTSKKLYLYAKLEGEKLRLFRSRIAPVQQW